MEQHSGQPLHFVDFGLAVIMSALYCLGSCKSGGIGMPCSQIGETKKSKSTKYSCRPDGSPCSFLSCSDNDETDGARFKIPTHLVCAGQRLQPRLRQLRLLLQQLPLQLPHNLHRLSAVDRRVLLVRHAARRRRRGPHRRLGRLLLPRNLAVGLAAGWQFNRLKKISLKISPKLRRRDS